MIIPLPGGAFIDTGTDNTITSADNGRITLHTPLALSRLIERWKNQPNMAGLLSSYTDQLQLLENVLWDVIIKRYLDFAADAQLDTLGKIVGEPRNGLGDAAYRVRVRVRILINRSFGTARDIINVLRSADPARFRYTRFGTAAFRIDYLERPAITTSGQLGRFIRQARPAGVRASIVVPSDLTRGARWGSHYDAALNPRIGWGTIHSTSIGGLYASQQLT